MAATQPPKPRKLPRQQRSQQLVRAIREACLRILEEEGPDRLTTQRIADVAGVNIASVYQYFPNKEAVLANVFEQQLEQLADAAAAEFSRIDRLSRESFEATLAAIIEMEARQLARLHAMAPDFFLRYRQSFDVHRRVDELTQARSNPSWEQWFNGFLARYRHRLRDGDLVTLGFIARRSLEGCLHAALHQDPALLDDTSFRREVLELLQRYLLDDPPPPSP